VPGLTYDLWCDDRSFVASEQLAQSGRIAMQEASYFAERGPAQFDDMGDEFDADPSRQKDSENVQ
jgi:hypothetical protein